MSKRRRSRFLVEPDEVPAELQPTDRFRLTEEQRQSVLAESARMARVQCQTRSMGDATPKAAPHTDLSDMPFWSDAPQ